MRESRAAGSGVSPAVDRGKRGHFAGRGGRAGAARLCPLWYVLTLDAPNQSRNRNVDAIPMALSGDEVTTGYAPVRRARLAAVSCLFCLGCATESSDGDSSLTNAMPNASDPTSMPGGPTQSPGPEGSASSTTPGASLSPDAPAAGAGGSGNPGGQNPSQPVGQGGDAQGGSTVDESPGGAVTVNGMGGGNSGPVPDGAGAQGGGSEMNGAGAQAGAPTMDGAGGQGMDIGQGGENGQGGTPSTPADPLPPYVPEGYELAYDESFAEPSSFGELLIANPQEWLHSPEGYVEFTAATYAPPYRSPFSVALIDGISASSFVLEVEMLQTSIGEGHRDMVIMWNVVSPSEFYYAHISAEHDDVAHHIHIVDFADRAPITETFTPGFDWGSDAWRTLRVVRDASSGTMDVYDVDNDALILSATDTTFTAGFFGVGSFDNTGRVRNLKIWSPDATFEAIPFTF